ncbi:5'/3'-nucleotidase SurE [Hyperthermus butylicus]|uniref:5'-nucleotidase SurE n=1 Tax=Hyperthermus butylicus (strain DSM 5456 / JCM 9403 / PLM1-5) TaxID=415426 RepID=SURE_HYPBU|nr:5'/3'-nucleotidase SurE [Hyperthermus butylicus]A2BLQ8.1 RecName: Full=5'-nucleotidase SurE; AltName: Full=Nucleoside 5'-monophosphate phosphohydrolase [Hyperthermus butylicus DSM 5456]ABM80919.1 Acid phosphatase [Hyperthermus butylicus DSM 5456]
MASTAKILVTNDDGIHSPGLRLLYEAVKELGRVYVLAPETPKSASGLGITLHKPLRIGKVKIWGDTMVYITNGTPSDVIYIAIEEFSPRFDVVVSGVNIGDNTSIQVILSSGTIGAAAQAALLGIPGIAFSADIDEASQLEEDRETWENMKRVIRAITSWVLEHGMPEGVDLISVNFPRKVRKDTKVKIAPAARIKFLQKVSVLYDPRGRKYYWLYGTLVEPEPGSDVYVVHVEKAIAITPLSLNVNVKEGEWAAVVENIKPMIQAAESALRAQTSATVSTA